MKLFPFCVQATSCDGSWVHRHDVVTIKSVIIALQLCVSIAIMEEEIVDVDVRP